MIRVALACANRLVLHHHIVCDTNTLLLPVTMVRLCTSVFELQHVVGRRVCAG